jgi:hypothetical protein
MPISRFQVHRRSLKEREALGLLRGREGGEREGELAACFAQLRESAVREGMIVFPPNAPYISGDEMTLLSWIAQAQRMGWQREAVDPRFAALIAQCARELLRSQIRLSRISRGGD